MSRLNFAAPYNTQAWQVSHRCRYDTMIGATCLEQNADKGVVLTRRCCAYGSVVAALLASACTPGGKGAASGDALALSPIGRLDSASGRNSITAVGPRTGAIYVAWAHDVPAPATSSSERADPFIRVLAARSASLAESR